MYSLNSDKIGTIEKNLKSDLFDLEGGESRISIQSKSDEVEKKDYSIPLLIVANKIDKLSPSEKIALQSACSQQVFVVSMTLCHAVVIESFWKMWWHKFYPFKLHTPSVLC